MQTRNPASVLPDPVGAAISVFLPAAISGQPALCAGVGPSGKRRSNQALTAGWKAPISFILDIEFYHPRQNGCSALVLGGDGTLESTDEAQPRACPSGGVSAGGGWRWSLDRATHDRSEQPVP